MQRKRYFVHSIASMPNIKTPRRKTNAFAAHIHRHTHMHTHALAHSHPNHGRRSTQIEKKRKNKKQKQIYFWCDKNETKLVISNKISTREREKKRNRVTYFRIQVFQRSDKQVCRLYIYTKRRCETSVNGKLSVHKITISVSFSITSLYVGLDKHLSNVKDASIWTRPKEKCSQVSWNR